MLRFFGFGKKTRPELTPNIVVNSTNALPLPRGTTVLLACASLLIVVLAVKQVASLVAPTFLALTLVITVHPLHQRLRKHGWPVWLSTLTCLTVLFGVLIALVYALGASVAALVEVMPTYQMKFSSLWNQVLAQLESVGIGQDQLWDRLRKVDPGQAFGVVQQLLNGLLNATTLLIFLLSVMLFMAMDANDFPRRMAMIKDSHPHIVHALEGFSSGVRSYWIVTTVFGLIVAALDTVALWILGVPMAVLWGLFAFITNYIPNVGFVIGLVPPALLALLEGGVWDMIWVIVIYVVLNTVIQTFIQPKVTGDAVGLTPTVAFLSLVFWAWVLGPLGALLAIPVSIFVKALLVDADPRMRWFNALVSNQPHTDAAGDPQPSGPKPGEPEVVPTPPSV